MLFRSANGIICCCFKTVSTCVCFFILLLVLLILAIWFLFPAIPDVSVTQPQIPSNGITINGVPQTGNPFDLSFETASDITVKSNSNIEIVIKQMDVSIKIKDLNGNVVENFVGKGTVKDQAFPAKQSTTFRLPIKVGYNSTGTKDLVNDPAVKTLVTNCVNSANGVNSQISLRFDFAAISWLGIFPVVNVDQKLPCPDVTALLNLVKGGGA